MSLCSRSALRAATVVHVIVMAWPLSAFAEEQIAENLTVPQTTFAIGAGIENMPKWLGAKTSKRQAIPFLDINWHDQVELLTTDGLVVDLIHAERLHGGLVGTLMWGRSQKDLGDLASAVPTLDNTLQGGVYLEYAFDKALSAGLRWRHDIQQTGAAYADVYLDWTLPKIGYIEHSVKIDSLFMNDSAMRRYFGVSADSAAALGVSAYQPNAGLEGTSLNYQVFCPTSQSTAIVFSANWTLLQGDASRSPLVRDFGARLQPDYSAAFIAHF